jgi:hypothetical protein
MLAEVKRVEDTLVHVWRIAPKPAEMIWSGTIDYAVQLYGFQLHFL